MFSKFARRSEESELMDDLSRPDTEFDEAYRELKVVNRRLGGLRAIERFLPHESNLLMLDVAAGGCDISEALLQKGVARIIALDINAKGFKFARKSWLLVGDAMELPFPDNTFDVVMGSLFFHHLSDDQCVRALQNMWRVSRRLVLVNDLHRHPVAYFSIRFLSAGFSKSTMFQHDAAVSVLRAFTPAELAQMAKRAGVPARVHRSFPFRLVLVARK
jgi:ubiquinone/menaquinone biosynthesis C-methylase UbiE